MSQTAPVSTASTTTATRSVYRRNIVRAPASSRAFSRGRSKSCGRPQERPDLVSAIYVAKPDLVFESPATGTKVSIKLEALKASGLVTKVTEELLKGSLVELEKGGQKITCLPKELPPPLLGEAVRCVMTHLHAAVAASMNGCLALQTSDYGKGEYGENRIEKMADLEEQLRNLNLRYGVEEKKTSFKPMKKEAFKNTFGVPISKE